MSCGSCAATSTSRRSSRSSTPPGGAATRSPTTSAARAARRSPPRSSTPPATWSGRSAPPGRSSATPATTRPSMRRWSSRLPSGSPRRCGAPRDHALARARAAPLIALRPRATGADLVTKAARSGADAVVVDLEDAVPSDAKAQARDVVRRWLADEYAGPRRWVRIDAAVEAADLAAAGGQPPRRDHAGRVPGRRAGASGVVVGAGRRVPTCRVVGLVEDAAGLREIAAMAQAPHLATVGIGEVDLLADLRVNRRAGAADRRAPPPGRGGRRRRRAAAPVAPTSTDFRDLDGFRATTRALLDLGFRSRTAVHPAQVAGHQRGADARGGRGGRARAT